MDNEGLKKPEERKKAEVLNTAPPVDDESEAPTQLGELPPAPEVAPDELQQLKTRAAKAEEYWDRFVRLTADFDNYKKRAARERQEAVSLANENLLVKLLPALDAFEMALAATSNGPAGAQSLQTGVAMISNQLKSVLAEAGLEEIDANGKAFDPNLHEAVSQQETKDAPEGQVIRQIRKGYKFRNRLLRPVGVVVAQKPAA
jgi:molecular chaperone GrpE